MQTPHSMQAFFTKLKIVFDKIPIKARFLKDMDLNTSYSGFRYFMQDRNPTPSKHLMENLCDNMEYDLITIPIKRSSDQKEIRAKLEETFFGDLDTYLEKYGDDPARVYSKKNSNSSSASAIEAFAAPTPDVFDTEAGEKSPKIDVSDLF